MWGWELVAPRFLLWAWFLGCSVHPRTGTGKKHCLGRELGEGSMYSFLPLAQERLHQPHSQLQGVECPGRIFFVKIIAKFLFKLNTVPSTVFWFCFQKIYFLKFSEMDFFFPHMGGFYSGDCKAFAPPKEHSKFWPRFWPHQVFPDNHKTSSAF